MKYKILIDGQDRSITLFPENNFDKKVLELLNDTEKATITSSKAMEYGYSQYKEIQSLKLTLDYSVELEPTENNE